MQNFTFPWRLLGLLMLLILARLVGHAQNVGIGMTTPTQTLDVNGSLCVREATGPGPRLFQTNATDIVTPAATTYPGTGNATPTPAGTTIGQGYPVLAISAGANWTIGAIN